jgi:hypothetical protein
MNLKTRNIIAGSLHVITFIVILILYLVYKVSRTKSNINMYRMQLTGPINDSVVPAISPNTLSYCTTNGITGKNPGRCQVSATFQQPKQVTKFNVIWGCLGFFLITALAHFLYAWDPVIPGLSRDGIGFYSYAVNVEGWNPYRWFEYAISASLMSIILGVLQGTGEITSIMFMAGVTGAMQFSGLTVEALMKKSSVQLFGGIFKQGILASTASAWILFSFLWFANLYSFFSLIDDLNKKYVGVIDPQTQKQIKLPAFVNFVVVFQLLNYAFFGFVQFYQLVKNWKAISPANLIDFAKIEKYYIILSYAAKLGLAGGVSYGLILRTKVCPE